MSVYLIHSVILFQSFFQRFYRPLTAVISVLVAVTAIGVLNASILGHSRSDIVSVCGFLWQFEDNV